MAFSTGKVKTGGRQKGQQNKFTTTVKEAIMLTFNKLQKDKRANFLQWAKENPTEFYKIAAKLIPVQVEAKVETTEKQIFMIGETIVNFD